MIRIGHYMAQDCRPRLVLVLVGQFLKVQALHFHVDVDAVEQRAGEAFLVSGNG